MSNRGSSNRCSVIRLIGWTPPYLRCFKFNTDASYREKVPSKKNETRDKTYIASSSLIIFNDQGDIVFAYIRRSSDPTNSFVEEVIGIENVKLFFSILEPRWLTDNGFPQITIVSDSQDAVKVVTGARNLKKTGLEGEFYDKVDLVVENIRTYFEDNDLTNVTLIWNERERNHCADEATKTPVNICNANRLLEIKGREPGGRLDTIMKLHKVWPTYRAEVRQNL